MNELRKSLHDNYYEELPLKQMNTEVGHCHKSLIKHLEKPEHRLVLQIIDSQNVIAYRLSMDSFLAGFHLAWNLNNELNVYNKSPQKHRDGDSVAFSVIN